MSDGKVIMDEKALGDAIIKHVRRTPKTFVDDMMKKLKEAQKDVKHGK